MRQLEQQAQEATPGDRVRSRNRPFSNDFFSWQSRARRSAGKIPATYENVLLGITKASLSHTCAAWARPHTGEACSGYEATGFDIPTPLNFITHEQSQKDLNMGMVACFAGADAGTISRLKSNPDDIEEFLYPDDGESEPQHYMDVDKAWHCIHFMLTGSAEGGPEPLAGAFFGGEEIGEDMGYGPARLMTPQQVRSISAALSAISEESFKARYNPSALATADIYLADMCVRDGDEALDYLVQNYQELLEFYRESAERGDGAVLWIS